MVNGPAIHTHNGVQNFNADVFNPANHNTLDSGCSSADDADYINIEYVTIE